MRSKISATSPLKFSIESRPPLLSAPVGSAILARQDTRPALKHSAMNSLRLQGIGIPRTYPHHIENLTDSEWRFLIFFDNPDVQDIGFTGAIPAFSDRMIGSALGLTADQVARIPKQPADLLIVSKVNPVAK